MSGSTVLLLAALVLVGLSLRWFVRASPHKIAHALRAFATAFGALASTGLLFTGRYGIAFIALCATGFAFWSLRQSTRGATAWDAGGGGTDEGGTVGVETRYLRMRLDRASGEVGGVVLEGPYEGSDLADLDQSDLLTLLAEVARRDPKSVPLLETYLDRRFADWRASAETNSAEENGGGGAMDAALARKILGVAEGASPAEVREAHRRLMALHPDRGGSDYLAGQINRARDILLGKR